jgi:hypothetical protein
MTFILLGLSVLSLLVGVVTLTQATQGVGAICIACWFAILARIAQASATGAAPKPAKASASMKRCPHCDGWNSGDATVCKHCKQSFETVSQPPDATIFQRDDGSR